MTEYKGNAWKCVLCSEVVRRHYIDNCPRCDKFMIQIQGLPVIDSDPQTDRDKREARRQYSRDYYKRVTILKRKGAK
jgi:hypothetical protein